jgi:hypothetical protein
MPEEYIQTALFIPKNGSSSNGSSSSNEYMTEKIKNNDEGKKMVIREKKEWKKIRVGIWKRTRW